MTIPRLVVALAGAALGALGASYGWYRWVPHGCAEPAIPGRYQFLNCIVVGPPLWLNLTMLAIGILVALALYELSTRRRSRRS